LTRELLGRGNLSNEVAASFAGSSGSVVIGDQRVQHAFAPRLQGGQRAGFVGFRQSAIADHVGGQYRSKTALSAFFIHVA
jgi:hypothetical protein